MTDPHVFEHHSYDLLLGHKNPMALRLRDAHHQNVNVGDLVQFSGHNTLMDRQRFQVVKKMDHPTLHSAISDIKHSNLSARDKITMKNSFMGTHGPAAAQQPVTTLHLQPHPMPGNMNRTPGTLG